MPLTTVDQGLLSTNAQYTGFKNRIINGDMTIDQRNNGGTFSISQALAGFCVDRFSSSCTGATVATLQQSSVAPAGFNRSLSLTVTTPDTSVTGTDVVSLWQRIEGFNWADLGYGTASAQTSTLSFWVRASVTGNYGVRFSNSAYDRSYVAMYSISAANTWEYKTITIAGDTTGTWVGATNGAAIVVEFCLGTGSTYQTATVNAWQSGNFVATSAQTNLISTNGATFFLTGVQLERGQTATSFDVLPYTTELALCQRYCMRWLGNQNFENIAGGSFNAFNSTGAQGAISTPVTMRTTPTITFGTLGFTDVASINNSVSNVILTTANSGPNSLNLTITTTGLTTGRTGYLYANNSTSAFLIASAEL
jgi:hypothetical protein